MGLFNTKKDMDGEDEIMDTIRIDMAEDDANYYIYADVPGVRIENIRICFKGEKFLMRIIEDTDLEEFLEEKSIIIEERLHSEAERYIDFPEPVNKNKKDVSADISNGLLTVIIKKLNLDEEEENLIQIQAK